MSKLVPSEFCRYEMDDVEILQGSIISPLQQQCIQNQIADLAKEKIELTFTITETQQYWQREAELQGAINALKFLLTTSEAASEQLRAHLTRRGDASHHSPGEEGVPAPDAVNPFDPEASPLFTQ